MAESGFAIGMEVVRNADRDFIKKLPTSYMRTSLQEMTNNIARRSQSYTDTMIQDAVYSIYRPRMYERKMRIFGSLRVDVTGNRNKQVLSIGSGWGGFSRIELGEGQLRQSPQSVQNAVARAMGFNVATPRVVDLGGTVASNYYISSKDRPDSPGPTAKMPPRPVIMPIIHAARNYYVQYTTATMRRRYLKDIQYGKKTVERFTGPGRR